jgi:hypothetical protein
MKVNDMLVLYPWDISPRCPLYRRNGGPLVVLDIMEMRKISCLYQEWKSDSSLVQPVA